MSPAPTATSRGGGATASAKTVRASSSRSSGPLERVVVPPLAEPLARDDDVARAALDRRCAGERLDEDVDLAAAGQADAPGLVVGDAVGDDRRRLTGEDRLGTLGDVGFDAAAGDRAEHAARCS